MAKSISEIKSADWSPSIVTAGEIVEDTDDINQCILIIVMTEKGSDPLRPEFGCSLLKYVDLPNSIAIPNLISEIVDGIKIWEKRAKVTRIVHEEENGQINFSLYWEDARKQSQSKVSFFLTDKKTIGFTTTPSGDTVRTSGIDVSAEETARTE